MAPVLPREAASFPFNPSVGPSAQGAATTAAVFAGARARLERASQLVERLEADGLRAQTHFDVFVNTVELPVPAACAALDRSLLDGCEIRVERARPVDMKEYTRYGDY